MTPKEKPVKEDKKLQTLHEICENTREIRINTKPLPALTNST
jgi:hypothetical protein